MGNLSRLLGWGYIVGAVRRILETKSTRGVSFSLSLLGLASKPLGYLRVVLIAWLFGTSMEMDAYHLAAGIVGFIAASLGFATESAVLPELSRVRKDNGFEACKSVFACVAIFLAVISLLFSAAIMAAPGMLIRFFAGGFDDARVHAASLMLWCLAPYAIVSICSPAVSIWALFTERFTLRGVTSMIFNFIAIPILLFSSPFIGAYSVAVCISVGHAASFLLLIIAMRGFPLRVERKLLPSSSVARIGSNSFFAMCMISAQGLFVIVDRYFASLLPVGSVAAISYSSQMIGIISSVALTPMSFFLARISGMLAESPEAAKSFVGQAMSVCFAYFIPLGFLVSASARPIISLLLGWGSFGAESVDMTSVAFAAYAIGMIFGIAGTIAARYAQACQRLGRGVALTVVMVGINALLDWLLVRRWGLLGLASATSVTQFLSFILAYKVFMRDSLWRFLLDIRFFQQIVLIVICALIVASASSCGTILHLAAAFIGGVVCLALSERLGFMAGVPKNWRPSSLACYVISGAKGIFRG